MGLELAWNHAARCGFKPTATVFFFLTRFTSNVSDFEEQ